MRIRLSAIAMVASLLVASQASAALLMVDDFVAPAGVSKTPDNPIYLTSTAQNLSRYQGSAALGSSVIGGAREQSAQNNQSSYTTANMGGTTPTPADTASSVRYYSTVNASAGVYSFGNSSTRYYPNTSTASTTIPTAYSGRGMGGLQYDGSIETGGARRLAKGGTTTAPLERGLTANLTPYNFLVFQNFLVEGAGRTGTTSGTTTTNRAFQMTVTFNSRATGTAKYTYTRDILLDESADFFYMPLAPIINDPTGWVRTTTGGTTALPASLADISGIQIWFDNTNTAYSVNSKVSFSRVFFSDSVIPEPSSVVLGVAGMLGMVWAARRRGR